MMTTIPIRRESLARQLSIHRSNLAALEEQAAIYGIRVPLELHNEIEHARRQIEQLEQMLAATDGSTTLDISIDDGLDTLLRAITLIQLRMEQLMKAWEEDHRRTTVMWRKTFPSRKHRLSVAVAIMFLVMAASLIFIKESRDTLFGSAWWLGVVVVGLIIICAPLIYLFGRDDYYDDTQ